MRGSDSPAEIMVAAGRTAPKYLRNTGQTKDLDFILTHVDDLNEVYRFERNQVIKHVEELLLA